MLLEADTAPIGTAVMLMHASTTLMGTAVMLIDANATLMGRVYSGDANTTLKERSFAM